MVLYNADGSRAEISGNGIRCLVQAAIMAQQRSEATTYLVHTDAGERFVDIRLVDANVIEASVVDGADLADCRAARLERDRLPTRCAQSAI